MNKDKVHTVTLQTLMNVYSTHIQSLMQVGVVISETDFMQLIFDDHNRFLCVCVCLCVCAMGYRITEVAF